MLYGAYGYTGRLVLEQAVKRGHTPILSGRSQDKLLPLANQYGLEARVVDPGIPGQCRDALRDVHTVVNCAGPFVHTYRPIIDACLEAGTNYLDITGEIPVFEGVFSYDRQAKDRGICLIPGVGFDVVPSDCLAKYVSLKLPDASELEIAFVGLKHPSAGTLKTMVEMLSKGGIRRRNGSITSFPLGRGVKKVRFAKGTFTVMPIPWGDLETAFFSTHIPDITTYMAYPMTVAYTVRVVAPLVQWLFSKDAVRKAAWSAIDRRVSGPDEGMRSKGRSFLWARVMDKKGKTAEAWLDTLEGYRFTGVSAVLAVEAVLRQRPTGSLTPSLAFGPDFVLGIEGTRRYDRL